jgi:DNA repair protein RecN (Recombination protein N)
MLQRLRVENYTIMPRAEVLFSPGLNVITGETGAGKSLLLDAVGFLLGERRTGFPIRAGASRAVIEAEFNTERTEAIRRWLDENGFSPDLPLILRREFQESGRNRLFINDTPATLAQSRALGDLLLDMHGQHEAVALFDRARQLDFLDDFADDGELLDQYRLIFQALKASHDDLTDLQMRLTDAQSGREVLLIQKRELSDLNPKPGEIDGIEAELKRLENAQRIFQLCSEICDRLNESPGSAVEDLTAAQRKLPELFPFNPEFESWAKDLEDARVVMVDLNRTLQDFSRGLRHDPAYVEELKERVTALIGFRKRWNYGTMDLVDVAAQIDSRLADLESLETRMTAVRQRISVQEKELIATGKRLSQRRKEAAKSLQAAVKEKLASIGMPQADFRVEFAPLQTEAPYADGLDRIEFTLSPDGKLPHQPLRQVVSGGEMSRILLALKTALAGVDRVETLIFDEIDQGVSGRVAHMVGLQLLELARSRQVIVVTHLAQIASLGQAHHSVQAGGDDGGALVKTLTEEERVQELASLLASAGISQGALMNAREMLDSARALREKTEKSL